MSESVDIHQQGASPSDVPTAFSPSESAVLPETNQPKLSIHIEPIRRGDLRALVDLLRKKDLLPTKAVTTDDITRRDIIEYAYTRLMAYALDQAATKLLAFNFSQGNVQKLREEIADVVLDVDTAPDGLQFTPAQRIAFENALNLLIDDLVDFRANLPNENEDQYVREHLGTRFEQLPPNSYTFDTKTYPGVVVVRIPAREDYIKVAPEDSQGVYNQTLGEGKLKGRVLVVRGKIPPDASTEYHEYLHFLNSKLRHLEPLPKKEKQATAKIEERTEPIERKLDELTAEKEKIEDKKYNEMQLRGRASDAVRQQLMGIRQRMEKFEQARDTAAYFAQAEVITYSDPDVKKSL